MGTPAPPFLLFYRMTKKFYFVVFLFFLAAFRIKAEDGGFLYMEGDFYFFQGEGKANHKIPDETRRRSLSREAAILEAKAKMAQFVYGQRPNNYAKLESAVERDKRIKTYVSVFLKGTQVVDAQWDDQGNCTAVVKINKKDLFRKTQANKPKK